MADQNQKSGKGSINFQVRGDLMVGGISAAEARQIAIDVMRAELNTLTADAYETFNARVTEFADALVNDLAEKSPEKLATFKQPDTQISIHTAQKEYGKSGDGELRDLLLTLLADIFKEEERNLKKIVLGECVEVAGKLTSDQINALSVIYLLLYTRNSGANIHAEMAKYLYSTVIPFSANLPLTQARFQHLEFAGCGTIGMGRKNLSSLLKSNYPSVYSAGFPKSELEGTKIETLMSSIIIPCQNNSEQIQFYGLHPDDLDGMFVVNNWPEDEKDKVRNLLGRTLPDQEIIDLTIRLCPEFEKIDKFWKDTPAKNMHLTSVGIAIGHANLKRQTGTEPNLDVWIN